MKRAISERVALLSILPKEGSITNLRIVRKMREDLSFSEEELVTHKLTDSEQGVTWDPGPTDPFKDVEIGEKATDVIVAALKKADSREKLTEAHIGIWDKFVGQPT